MLSVLVIGAGMMGQTHIKAYQEMNHVKLVGIVDKNINKANQVAQGDTKTFASFDEATAQLDKVDVIDICLPTYLHKEYVEQAATLGKDIICEKPLGHNLKEAVYMKEFCENRNVRLFVGHVVRFIPEYSQAKQLVESGTIGNAGVVRTSRNSGFPDRDDDWFADFNKSGGVVLDLIIHDFDFLRWCFGEVERVFAKGLYGRGFLKKDYALVTLKFENGVIAHVEGSWSHDVFQKRFEFAGDNGAFEYDSLKERSISLSLDNNDLGAVTESPTQHSPYYLELSILWSV